MDNNERNKQIALMLGWDEEQPGSWFTVNENSKYVVYSEHNNYPYKGLPFNRDWNWLMKGVEFIKTNIRISSSNLTQFPPKVGEYFIDEWRFQVKSFFVTFFQWTDNGWRMVDNNNKDLCNYYVIGENCESEMEAIFLFVSNFAKIYNESK